MAPPKRGGTKQKRQNDNFAAEKSTQQGKRRPPKNATPVEGIKTGEHAANAPTDYQFTYEVMFCLELMDALRTAPKTTEKQAADIRKAMKSLLNDKTLLIKKRQLMRLYCGDYRAKMEEDERKQRAVKASLATRPSLPKDSQFVRAAPHCSSGGPAALADPVDRLSLEAADAGAVLLTQKQNCSANNATNTSSVSQLFKNKSDSSFTFNFNVSEND